MTVVAIAALFFLPMLGEFARARRNERSQRARGGVEPPDDVYPVMRVAYPAVFLLMLAESAARGTASPPSTPVMVAGLAVFIAGKGIKWWAIHVLGRCWTFRVIVVPGDARVLAGPYRYLRHPNYAGVLMELVGAALMTRALVTGPIGVAAFAVLLYRRIAVEERALRGLA
jgi:methyltransferase